MAACSRRPRPPASPWSIRCSSPWSIYREVDLAELWRIVDRTSAFLISQILMIVTAAGIYSWLLTTSGIPQQIVAAIDALHMPPWELLLLSQCRSC